MSKNKYATVYTREGKKELTENEWVNFDDSKLYREGDLPVVEYEDCAAGVKYWFKYGELHRETGPALIGLNGVVIYYLVGKHYSERIFHEKLRKVDELPLSLALIHEEEWVRERAKNRNNKE